MEKLVNQAKTDERIIEIFTTQIKMKILNMGSDAAKNSIFILKAKSFIDESNIILEYFNLLKIINRLRAMK